MNEYFNIGKFIASFGLQGELVLQHALHKKTALKGIDALFVELLKDSRLPYFIEYARPKDDQEIFIKLEGIDTREASNKLVKKKVWLSRNDFLKHADKSSPVTLLGYLVINEDEVLGPVEEVIEQTHQVLLRINRHNRETFIPLHEQTLQKIDHKKKEVHVILPDGLLDIYK